MHNDTSRHRIRSWLERLTHVLLREPKDREQLLTLLRDAEQRHLLDAQSLGMIEGVLQVSDMPVRDIMIPRSQMVVVEHDALPEEFIPVITASGHSRFPVVGDDKQAVIGILIAKDLLNYHFHKPNIRFNLREILRPAMFIPESKRLDLLLQEFRNKHNHMAIVVDEYGSVAGLITIEDVLEQIVGEIADEYDIDEDATIKQHKDNQYTVKALTPIDEFNDYFNADLSNEEFDTIGGIVIHAFGHMPKRGESIQIGNFRFKVLHADNRRIHLLRVSHYLRSEAMSD